MKRKIALTTIVIIVFFFAVALTAQHQRNTQREQNNYNQQYQQNERGPHQVFQNLGLTEDQKDEIKNIFENMKEDIKIYRENVRTIRNEIVELLKGNGSESAVSALVEDIVEIEGDIAILKVKTAYSVKNILTQEQIEKLPDDFMIHLILQGAGNNRPTDHNRPPQNQNNRPPQY